MLPEEIVAAPIEAWRVWRVFAVSEHVFGWERMDEPTRDRMLERYGHLPVLFSVSAPTPWTPRVAAAHCLGREHDLVPGHRCECGFWAVTSRKKAERIACGVTGSGVAIGRVQLWGRIIEHTDGYRAQYARPVEIFLYDDPWGPTPERFEKLCRSYDVPVTIVPPPTRRPPPPRLRKRPLFRWFLFGIFIYVVILSLVRLILQAL